MSNIKSKSTLLEKDGWALLHEASIYFRKNPSGIFGNPDVANKECWDKEHQAKAKGDNGERGFFHGGSLAEYESCDQLILEVSCEGGWKISSNRLIVAIFSPKKAIEKQGQVCYTINVIGFIELALYFFWQKQTPSFDSLRLAVLFNIASYSRLLITTYLYT